MIDAELQEQIRVTKAAASALAGEEAPKQISVRDFLVELQKTDMAMAPALKALLDALLKMQSFEGSSVIVLPITTYEDPGQQQTTMTAKPLETASPPADSNFAQNASDMKKAVEAAIAKLQKSVEGKAGALPDGVRLAVAKATATEKLAEVTKLFGVAIDPTDDMWEIRSQIGDLVSLLCQQVKLENLLGNGATAAAKKAAKLEPERWPEDMAKAEFDPAGNRFTQKAPHWGHDSARR